jgi:hypothetical protein
MLIDRFGGRQRVLQEELRLAHDRIALLERQNTQLERQNAQLSQQIEWHARFLRTLEEQHRIAGAREPTPLLERPHAGAAEQLPNGERAEER